MTLRRLAGAVALAAGLLCAGGAARAQVVDDVADVAPVQMGPVQLYPVYETSLEYIDNLYYNNDQVEPTATAVASMNPSLLFELPFRQSKARLGYAYRYRDYTTGSIPANGAHFFQSAVTLQFASGFRLEMRDDLQNGVLDTEAFDPGGAVRFSGQRFKTNNAFTGIGYQWARTLVIVGGSRQMLRFSDPLAAYYDTDGWQAEVSVDRSISKTVHLLGSYSSSRSRLTPPPNRADLDARTEIEQGINVGVNVVFSPSSFLVFRVGRPTFEYVSANPEKGRSLVGSLNYRRGVPTGLQLQCDVSRGVYASVFQSTNSYTDNRLTVSLSNDARARLVMGGSLSYYSNRYPTTDVSGQSSLSRRDGTFETGLWIGYRLAGNLEWRVFARGEWRDSNVPGFGYDVRRIGATLSVGGG